MPHRGAALVAAAEALARAAHAGQLDKAGQAYAAHPQRVAARVADDPIAAAVAWLHDVVEDTDLGLGDLRGKGFPEPVVQAVGLLTRRAGVAPDDYYRAIRADPIAVRVKLADLADNSDPARLAALDEPTRARLSAKYARARAALTAGLDLADQQDQPPHARGADSAR